MVRDLPSSTRRSVLRNSAIAAGATVGGITLGAESEQVAASSNCPDYAEECWQNSSEDIFRHGQGKIRYHSTVVLAKTDRNYEGEDSSGPSYLYTFEVFGYHTVTYKPDDEDEYSRNAIVAIMDACGIELSSQRGDIFHSDSQKRGPGIAKEDAYTYDDAYEDATKAMAGLAVGAYDPRGAVVYAGADLAASAMGLYPNEKDEDANTEKWEWRLDDINDNYDNNRRKTDGQSFANFKLEVPYEDDVADLNARTYLVPDDSYESDSELYISLDQSGDGTQ
jgi:hypothetical protein